MRIIKYLLNKIFMKIIDHELEKDEVHMNTDLIDFLLELMERYEI